MVQPSVDHAKIASPIRDNPTASRIETSHQATIKGLTQAARVLENPLTKGRLRGGCNDPVEPVDFEDTPPQWKERLTYKSYIRNLPECLEDSFSKFLTERAEPQMLQSFKAWESSTTSLVVWKSGSEWDAVNRDRFQMFIRKADGAIPEFLLARLLLDEDDEHENFFTKYWSKELRNKTHHSAISALRDIWVIWFGATHEEPAVLNSLTTVLDRKLGEWKRLCAATLPPKNAAAMAGHVLRVLFFLSFTSGPGELSILSQRMLGFKDNPMFPYLSQDFLASLDDTGEIFNHCYNGEEDNYEDWEQLASNQLATVRENDSLLSDSSAGKRNREELGKVGAAEDAILARSANIKPKISIPPSSASAPERTWEFDFPNESFTEGNMKGHDSSDLVGFWVSITGMDARLLPVDGYSALKNWAVSYVVQNHHSWDSFGELLGLSFALMPVELQNKKEAVQIKGIRLFMKPLISFMSIHKGQSQKSLRRLLNLFPISNGWTKHTASVEQVFDFMNNLSAHYHFDSGEALMERFLNLIKRSCQIWDIHRFDGKDSNRIARFPLSGNFPSLRIEYPLPQWSEYMLDSLLSIFCRDLLENKEWSDLRAKLTGYLIQGAEHDEAYDNLQTKMSELLPLKERESYYVDPQEVAQILGVPMCPRFPSVRTVAGKKLLRLIPPSGKRKSDRAKPEDDDDSSHYSKRDRRETEDRDRYRSARESDRQHSHRRYSDNRSDRSRDYDRRSDYQGSRRGFRRDDHRSETSRQGSQEEYRRDQKADDRYRETRGVGGSDSDRKTERSREAFNRPGGRPTEEEIRQQETIRALDEWEKESRRREEERMHNARMSEEELTMYYPADIDAYTVVRDRDGGTELLNTLEIKRQAAIQVAKSSSQPLRGEDKEESAADLRSPPVMPVVTEIHGATKQTKAPEVIVLDDSDTSKERSEGITPGNTTGAINDSIIMDEDGDGNSQIKKEKDNFIAVIILAARVLKAISEAGTIRPMPIPMEIISFAEHALEHQDYHESPAFMFRIGEEGTDYARDSGADIVPASFIFTTRLWVERVRNGKRVDEHVSPEELMPFILDRTPFSFEMTQWLAYLFVADPKQRWSALRMGTWTTDDGGEIVINWPDLCREVLDTMEYPLPEIPECASWIASTLMDINWDNQEDLSLRACDKFQDFVMMWQTVYNRLLLYWRRSYQSHVEEELKLIKLPAINFPTRSYDAMATTTRSFVLLPEESVKCDLALYMMSFEIMGGVDQATVNKIKISNLPGLEYIAFETNFRPSIRVEEAIEITVKFKSNREARKKYPLGLFVPSCRPLFAWAYTHGLTGRAETRTLHQRIPEYFMVGNRHTTVRGMKKRPAALTSQSIVLIHILGEHKWAQGDAEVEILYVFF